MDNIEIINGIRYIACPNMCHSGMVKHFPDSDKALYSMVKCSFCNGKGIIKESDKSRIEASIDNYDIYQNVVIFPNLNL